MYEAIQNYDLQVQFNKLYAWNISELEGYNRFYRKPMSCTIRNYLVCHQLDINIPFLRSNILFNTMISNFSILIIRF
jgi:hypothetical protein